MSERTVRAYIGLGANLGDAEATLTEAVRALAALPDVRDELTQAITERPVVRAVADDRHVVSAGGEEPTTVVLGERRPCLRDPARERA